MAPIAQKSPSRAAPGAYRTASVLLLRALFAYARSEGIDVAILEHELELTPALLEDTDGRIDESVLHRAWAHVAVASGDSALGIQAAQHARLGDYEVLDYAIAFSGTLREAVERIVRFHRLLSDAAALELRSHIDATELVHPARGSPAEEQDAWLVGIMSRLRLASGFELVPRQVYFEHAERAASELEAYFRCPVRFGRAGCGLVIAASDLARPIPAANPRLAALLDRYAADLLERLPATSFYDDHVRRAVARAIQHTAPTLKAVARLMHASPRTLQRRLEAAGTTHKRIVDEARRELALRYIESNELSITEISYLLGYEDVGSFRRAFKRWTGRSPLHARSG